MWISVEAIAINMAVLTTLFTLVNSRPNITLFNYSLKEQFGDIMPAICMSIVVFICVYLVSYLPVNDIQMLVIQIIIGALVYFLLSKMTGNKEFNYIYSLLYSKIKNKSTY